MARAAQTPDERGSALVEVIVSGVLLVVLAVGLFPVLDTATSSSGSARARAVASAMASDTIEQMRAMPVTTLSGYTDSHDTTVRGVVYHVTSKAQWMRDGSGEVTCALETSGVEYLRLRTTVDSPAMTGDPVTMESLVAPPKGAFDPTAGTLVVQTRDAAGNALAGVSVSGGGRSGVSGSDGCVVLVMIAAGPVTVTAQKSGYVTPNMDPVASFSSTVIAGRTSSTSVQFDRPMTVAASFDTVAKSGQAATAVNADDLSAATPPLAAPVIKAITPAASSTSMTLFPFKDGYGLYAGDCSGNDPTKYASDHYQRFPDSLVAGTPAGALTARVRVPSLWVRSVRSGNVGFQATRITAVPNLTDDRMTGCTGKWVLTANASGDAIAALPFGVYTVCAADGNGRRATGNVLNTAATGASAAQLTLTVPTSGFGSGCA
jgi:Tfp pilus assembly protein PilV